ncbi:sphingolipid Delta4-desaturase, partial [Teladorsagia circumcincta]
MALLYKAHERRVWKENRMGQSISRDDFIWTYTDQPHTSRRATIVKAHPEIKELFGIDVSFKFVVIAMVLFQVAFDLFILQMFGVRPLVYLILGTLVAMGVHPSAGHFISEHYVFKETQETY